MWEPKGSKVFWMSFYPDLPRKFSISILNHVNINQCLKPPWWTLVSNNFSIWGTKNHQISPPFSLEPTGTNQKITPTEFFVPNFTKACNCTGVDSTHQWHCTTRWDWRGWSTAGCWEVFDPLKTHGFLGWISGEVGWIITDPPSTKEAILTWWLVWQWK